MRTLRQRLDTTAWEITSRFLPSLLGPTRPDWVARRLGTELARIEQQVVDDPSHIILSETSSGSQNGEDGIIAEIFGRIGPSGRTFIEFGAADGSENCTTALVDQGWSGVWIEGDPDLAAEARQLVGSRPVEVLNAFVDRDNIVDLLKESGASPEPDLLVVDIDGNDADVLLRVLGSFRPRVLVVEYNAIVGPRSHWTMPYDPTHTWDENWRHGAGLAALENICSRAEMVLVGCDSRGVNSFFVTESEAAHFTSRPVHDHWVPPRYHLPYGHPRTRTVPFTSPPLGDSDAASITFAVEPISLADVAGRTCVGLATVTNGGNVDIGESRDNPTRLAHYWTDARGHWVQDEPERSIQPWRAGPGSSAELVLVARAPQEPGEFTLHAALVQEEVRWLEPRLEVATIRT
ncbi:MAG: FkbM family methyltransferase [Actinomycetia bacterium]|nr:FkbM family methyltransferase [Actinomycetes bacterium]